MVEHRRFELLTSTMRMSRATNCANAPYMDDVTEPLPDIASRDNPYISVEIGEAIDTLPPKIRLTVILYYIEDYSVREIKEILHIPEGTVKSRLSKGRKLLKDQLDH